MMFPGKMPHWLQAERVLRLIISCFLLACALPAFGAADSRAESETGSEAGSDDFFRLERCIPTAWIRRTHIVDDRTIIFYMTRKKIYVNQLPHRCPGLRSAGAFSYRPRVSRLCDVDTIRVLRSTGSRIDSGSVCGLGKFRPVTEEEAAMIRNRETELPPKESKPGKGSGDSDSEAGDAETARSDQAENDG